MNFRNFVILALVAGAVFYYVKRGEHSKPSAATQEAGVVSPSASSSGSSDCLFAAEEADREVSAAAELVSRGSVDPQQWSEAESRASSAISAAESCSSSSSGTDAAAISEIHEATVSMRSLLSELSSSASGGSGSMAPRYMEEVSNHLEKAREKSGS